MGMPDVAVRGVAPARVAFAAALAASAACGPPATDAQVAYLRDPASRRSALVASLQRLPATDQEVLALAAWEELAPRDAAVVLNVSPTWYRVRLHRAKRRLLRELERSESTAGHARPVPTEGIAK